MFVTLRSTFMVIAALTASSVAPAQVHPAAVPLTAEGLNDLSVEVTPAVLPTTEAVDPLAPTIDEAQPQDETIEAGATLAETVAKLRSTDPGSRELECLAGAIKDRRDPQARAFADSLD